MGKIGSGKIEVRDSADEVGAGLDLASVNDSAGIDRDACLTLQFGHHVSRHDGGMGRVLIIRQLGTSGARDGGGSIETPDEGDQ